MCLQKLPTENYQVVTQLRDPVQRALSAYEFAVEVAGRRIHYSDEEYQKQRNNASIINTFNVWPWSHLIWQFREDMQHRVWCLQFLLFAWGHDVQRATALIDLLWAR